MIISEDVEEAAIGDVDNELGERVGGDEVPLLDTAVFVVLVDIEFPSPSPFVATGDDALLLFGELLAHEFSGSVCCSESDLTRERYLLIPTF